MEKDQWEINFKVVTVALSNGEVITGRINIRDKYIRFSDYLRATSDKFVLILPNPESGKTQKVIMVNKSSIVTAEAMD